MSLIEKENLSVIEIKEGFPDTISFWISAYFRFEVTTSKSSRKVQKRDLNLFCDFMIDDGGRSKDRYRFRDQERPVRKGYRPYRNRAIVYTLIETGMRRAATRNIDLRSLSLPNPMGISP